MMLAWRSQPARTRDQISRHRPPVPRVSHLKRSMDLQLRSRRQASTILYLRGDDPGAWLRSDRQGGQHSCRHTGLVPRRCLQVPPRIARMWVRCWIRSELRWHPCRRSAGDSRDFRTLGSKGVAARRATPRKKPLTHCCPEGQTPYETPAEDEGPERERSASVTRSNAQQPNRLC